jgi:hypothetical protein
MENVEMKHLASSDTNFPLLSPLLHLSLASAPALLQNSRNCRDDNQYAKHKDSAKPSGVEQETIGNRTYSSYSSSQVNVSSLASKYYDNSTERLSLASVAQLHLKSYKTISGAGVPPK